MREQERVGTLFEPRRLLCRRSLGLRHGNQPEKIRLDAQRMLDRRARERRLRDRGLGTLDWVRSVREAGRRREDGREAEAG
jgi:hypothetical protein